jgi:phosphate:Na+ symporter
LFRFILLGLGVLAYLLFAFPDLQVIVAGVAIFMVGMFFMEDGFKQFTGGPLESILQKTTNTVPKSIFSGFLTTSIIQSSSLMSVIAISFLSAELIGLAQGVGIIFGANIGTTTTAWIVSAFGLKIHISHYAMPMLIFGIILRFMKSKNLHGTGNILLGLGFIFLGIGYMKEGFETMKEGIDLAQFAMEGFKGVFVYILVGMVATIVIQSSSATMAIIIVALSSGQIEYVNALALAIGANIGTTVTAIIGALTSNANGKRLAVAHLIFNIITAAVATIFIYQLKDIVEVLSPMIGIGAEEYAMKLSLFHTIFNILGVALVSPFIHKLVKFLNTLFIQKSNDKGKPKFIYESSAGTSISALIAIQKESEHLYDNALEIISHGVSLHRTDIFSDKDVENVVLSSDVMQIDIEKEYTNSVKRLYGEIIRFASFSSDDLSEKDSQKVYELKVANRGIVRAIKDIEKVQKNINQYFKSPNETIRDEYNTLRKKLIEVLRTVQNIRNDHADFTKSVTNLEILRDSLKEIDIIENGRIDKLIRENNLEPHMATSLINDSIYIYNVGQRVIDFTYALWIDDDILTEYEDLEVDIKD